MNFIFFLLEISVVAWPHFWNRQRPSGPWWVFFFNIDRFFNMTVETASYNIIPQTIRHTRDPWYCFVTDWYSREHQFLSKFGIFWKPTKYKKGLFYNTLTDRKSFRFIGSVNLKKRRHSISRQLGTTTWKNIQI